jgi:hypothetical protein
MGNISKVALSIHLLYSGILFYLHCNKGWANDRTVETKDHLCSCDEIGNGTF